MGNHRQRRALNHWQSKLCGHCSRAGTKSLAETNCADTIRGRILIEGGNYSRKYGICRYVGMSVCLSCPKMRRQNYVRACSKSVLGGKN